MPLIQCPHCGQSIDADDQLAGMEAACPTCGGSILVPLPAPPVVEKPGLKLYPVGLPKQPAEVEPPRRSPVVNLQPAPAQPALPIYPTATPSPAPAVVATPLPSPSVEAPAPAAAPMPPLPPLPPAAGSTPPFLPPLPAASPPLNPSWTPPSPSYAPEGAGGFSSSTLPPPSLGAGSMSGVPVPYDDYLPAKPEETEAEDEGSWNKRAGGAAFLCWVSAGGYLAWKLYPVLRIPSGWAWGLMGYGIAQATIFLFVCVLLGLALGALFAAVGRSSGASFQAAFGRSMVTIMLLLAVLNVAWHEGVKKSFPTAALAPVVSFFTPDPMAGASGNAADGFRSAVSRFGESCKPLFSGRVFPRPEGQSDVEKFRWLVNDRLNSLEGLLPDYRRLMAEHQENGAFDFMTTEWLGRETGPEDSLRILEGIRMRAVACQDRCDATLLTLPSQMAGAGFSHPEENTMQGQVGQMMEKDAELFKAAWDAEVKVVDATIDWVSYLRKHRDRWTAVDGRIVYAQATDRTESDRLRGLSETAAGNAKTAEDTLAAALPQDIARVEKALTAQP